MRSSRHEHRQTFTDLVRAVAILGLLIIAVSCHGTSYSDADHPVLLDRFGGLDLVTTDRVALPLVGGRWPYNPPPPGLNSAATIELPAFTHLRIVHFEDAVEWTLPIPIAVELPITVQAEVQAGPDKGQRIVVGALALERDGSPYVVTINEPAGLSASAGGRIEAVGPDAGSLISHNFKQYDRQIAVPATAP